jgi:hypothetical protein
MKKIMPLFVILALAFFALAIYYWVTPAGSLPHYMPGYQTGSSQVHLKHGLVALILGIGSVILAWFSLGAKAEARNKPIK